MSEQVTRVSVDILNVHPDNTKYFDDIDGKTYQQFKNSIKEDGVISPLLVAPDMTIISGHQRYKASKDLGFDTVPVIIRGFESEEEKLKKLLASNFGRIKNDEAKQRKVAVKYVELCGYKNGGDRKSDSHNGKLNQEEIAQQLGVSTSELNRMLSLERKLTPELKELLDIGVINKTAATRIWTKLSEKEQKEFLEEIGTDKLADMTIDEQNEKVLKAQQEAKELKRKLEQERREKEQYKAKADDEKLAQIEAEKEEVKQRLIGERNKLEEDYKQGINQARNFIPDDVKDKLQKLEERVGEINQYKKQKSKLEDDILGVKMEMRELQRKNERLAKRATVITKVKGYVKELEKGKVELEEVLVVAQSLELEEDDLKILRAKADFLRSVSDSIYNMVEKQTGEGVIYEV